MHRAPHALNKIPTCQQEAAARWRLAGFPRKDARMSATFGYRDVEAAEKAGLVRGVFERVAGRYDRMNDLMSLGAHRIWKDAAAARLNPQPGELIVDCAGGTGDMARRFAGMARRAQARRGGPDARIVVVDVNAEMVRAGLARGGEPEIAWAVGDAERLPLPDASADAYSIAFGLRNVTDIPGALAEARRVLKPGGRFLCLEFSRLTAAALRPLYDAYSFEVIPRIGERVAGDGAAYRYLVESIRRFPDQKALAKLMGAAGFAQVSVTNFTGGVAALHQGWAI
jgi:demethylmenaquinone methyltransferase/2-methoxy-6-polyprenyl-1,4-benzoquinol methylase